MENDSSQSHPHAPAKTGLFLVGLGLAIGAMGMAMTDYAALHFVLLGALVCVAGFGLALLGRFIRLS
jgi:hypothetical protein